MSIFCAILFFSMLCSGLLVLCFSNTTFQGVFTTGACQAVPLFNTSDMSQKFNDIKENYENITLLLNTPTAEIYTISTCFKRGGQFQFCSSWLLRTWWSLEDKRRSTLSPSISTSTNLTRSQKVLPAIREGFTKKSCSSFGFCPNKRGEGPAQIFVIFSLHRIFGQ